MYIDGNAVGLKGVYLYNSKLGVISDSVIIGNTQNGILINEDTATVENISVSGIMFSATGSPVSVTVSGTGVIGSRITVRDCSGFTRDGRDFEILDWASDLIRVWGVGSPEAAVVAGVGSYYFRTDGGAGTTLYIKESGTGTNTGWVAK